MPMQMSDYHPDWPNISRQIRQQAHWHCEGTPRFPNCHALAGVEHPETGSRVVLTVAHMDHDKSNNDPANLRALCQRCHLDWDLDHHMANARRTRWQKKLGGQVTGLPLKWDTADGGKE